MEPNITTQPIQQSQVETPVPQPIPEVPSKPGKSKFLLITLAFIILILVGASGYYIGSRKVTKQEIVAKPTVIPTTTPTTVPTSTVTSSLTPTQSTTIVPTTGLTANWKTYTNQKQKYSIKYPQDWFNLENFGAPDNYKYFSNKNTGSAMEMGPDGIFLTIKVGIIPAYYEKILSSGPGLLPIQGTETITKLSDLVIDGVKASKYIAETATGAQTEYSYNVGYAIIKNDTLYTIEFLTFGKSIADKNMQIYDEMAKSFKFIN